MADASGDWVAERTLGGRVCEFEWRVDETGGIAVRRQVSQGKGRKRIIVQRATREELERLVGFMADGAWHPLGGSSHAVSAGAHGDGLGLFLHQTLGWTIYAAGTAVHLAAIFTSTGLWEWNGRKKGMEFRQVDGGLDRLRAAFEQRLAEGEQPKAPAARKGTHPRAPFSLGARFRALSKGLEARVEEFEAGGRHAAEKGQRREAAVRDFLATHLPERYGITRGEVVAPVGETSLQMDALIYDRPNAPVLMESGGSRLLAVESVYAAIEVKPRLVLTELRKAVANIQSVKALSPALYIGPDAGVPIFGAIFAFESVDRRLLASQLHELQADVPPGLHVDAICILGSAYLYRDPGGGLSAWTPRASLSSIPLCAVPAGDDSLFLFYHHLLRDLRHKTLPFPHLEPYAGPLHLPPPEFL